MFQLHAERSKPVTLSPQLGDPGRIPVHFLVTALIFCLCVQSLGSVVVMLELLLLGLILLLRWRELPREAGLAIPILLLPTFAMASAAWSAEPMVSLRYGFQLGITILIGFALVRFIERNKLPLLVFIGTASAMLLGLLSGRTGPSADGPVLIGLAGSKNQMSYICLFWIASALCVAASSERHWLWRLIAAISLAPATLLLLQGDSMTALISALVLIAVLAAFAIASKLSAGARIFVLFASVALGLTLAAAAPQIEEYAQEVRTEVLQKDRRLTGRTLLWEAADRLIERRPVIGHGYRAVWMGEEGVGLLARNNQEDGRAFHFHDTVREIRVDLGLVGLILFLLPLAWAVLRAFPSLIDRVDAGKAFAASVIVLLLLRSRTELILGPFLIDTALLFSAITLFLTVRREARAPRKKRPDSLVARRQHIATAS